MRSAVVLNAAVFEMQEANIIVVAGFAFCAQGKKEQVPASATSWNLQQ